MDQNALTLDTSASIPNYITPPIELLGHYESYVQKGYHTAGRCMPYASTCGLHGEASQRIKLRFQIAPLPHHTFRKVEHYLHYLHQMDYLLLWLARHPSFRLLTTDSLE
jgi:hypothetical protein